MSAEILGGWIAAFLTLAILSFLYEDNPFYKFAEHLFVGVSAAYWACTFFWTQIHPNLFGRLWPAVDNTAELGGFQKLWYGVYGIFAKLDFLDLMFPAGGIDANQTQNLWYIMALALGIFMLLRLVPGVGWLSRWSLAYVVGLAAGLRMYSFLNSNVLRQIEGSIVPLFPGGDGVVATLVATLSNWIIVFGFLAGLVYFFFSKEHSGVFGAIARLGIFFLMISFGASFGFAVMGRISLLIGRFNDLIKYSGSNYGFATLILLVAIIATLALWSMSRKRQPTD